MKVIDVYEQYFEARCVFAEVERRAARVWLTAESDSGTIRYEIGLTFFPHRDETDFAVSYDAAVSREIYRAKGRRSAKREAGMLASLRETADELAASLAGQVFWDRPLREARRG